MTRRSALLVGGLAAWATAATPASAITASLTNDQGTPTSLSTAAPLGVRNVDVDAFINFEAGDQTKRFSSTVLDPSGALAATPVDCLVVRFAGPFWKQPVTYKGNGQYTLVVRTYAESDTRCQTPEPELRFPFQISASTAVTVPARPILLREPNSFSLAKPAMAISINPGAITHEIRFARGAVLAADGSISGPSEQAFANRSTGTADFFLKEPGTYTVVARTGDGTYFSPWSAPATFTVLAPFDLESTTFVDSRGPVYTIRATVREKSARGKVVVALAPGRKGGRFTPIATAKVDTKSRVTFTFTQRKLGVYRMKLTFAGSKTTAPGWVAQLVTFRRSISFA